MTNCRLLGTVTRDAKQPLLARLHAMWALGQILRRPNTKADADSLQRLTASLSDLEPEVRAVSVEQRVEELEAIGPRDLRGVQALQVCPLSIEPGVANALLPGVLGLALVREQVGASLREADARAGLPL